MKYARIEAGVVVEIVEAPRVENGVSFELAELYHPSLVAMMVACSDTTAIGDAMDLPPAPEPAAAATTDSDTGNGEPPPK